MGDFDVFERMEQSSWQDRDRAFDYVELFAAVPRQIIPDLIKSVHLHSGEVALDLCCGHGAVAQALVAARCEVTGLDFSPAMLELARSFVPLASFVEGDARKLPFPDGHFDLVISNFGIPHVPDQPLALKEVYRVLRPGGRLALSSWCEPQSSPCLGLLFNAIKSFGSPDVVLPPAPDFHQFSREATARELLINAQFDDIAFSKVDCVVELRDPTHLWDMFLRATARAAALLDAQPIENQQAIKQALIDAVHIKYKSKGSWRIPMPATVVRAQRPRC